MTWTNTTTTTGSTTLTYPVTITNGVTWIQPVTPRPPTPLEWLDGEIEKTCALARNTDGTTP